MLRSLTHYWRINLAVILGAAVATSVLTGALLVGDSVEGSLRQLTLGRLGKVDYAVAATRHFRVSLAQELEEVLPDGALVAPLLALQASLEVSDTGVRAHKVSLYGINDSFSKFFARSPVDEDASGRLRFLYANGPLRRTLDVEDGQAVVLSVERHSLIHREFLFGRDEAEDQVARTRVKLGKLVEDDAGGRFSFEPAQSIPLVVFVRLGALQRLMGVEGAANRLLISSEAPVAVIDEALAKTAKLEDYGLSLDRRKDAVSLMSNRFLLSDVETLAARSAAEQRYLPAMGVFTYLSNAMRSSSGMLPYSTISAVGPLTPNAPHGQLIARDGGGLGLPGRNDLFLNEHAAGRLNVSPGDSVALRYFEVESDESFTEAEVVLQVAGVCRPVGLAVDRRLTPDFPGLHEADNMVDWEMPFPIDFRAISEEDEAYWDDFGATPKAFISLENGQSLWSSRFGSLSSIRFYPTADEPLTQLPAVIEEGLLARLSPETQGLRVVPIRSQGLVAAKGATDFRGLFFGFSMFLVVSGLVMTSQLFKLGIQDRRSEIGLLKALGYTTSRVRLRILTEGLILGALGATIGIVGATLYAQAMIYGLSTWWVAAVGTRLLSYHGGSISLAAGWLITIILITIVLWCSVSGTGSALAIRLIRQARQMETVTGAGKTRLLFTISGILSVGLLAGSPTVAPSQQVGLFFCFGACSLIALLAGARLLARSSVGQMGVIGMACTQIVRFSNRSMASLTLIALAVFVLVTVGLSRHESGEEKGIPQGAGGFRWIGETTIPITSDLNHDSSLLDLGFSADDIDRFGNRDIHSFRLRPGEDVSCLNLYRPSQPRILGVSQRTIERGGFTFGGMVEGVDDENPWRALNVDLGEDVVPVIGDFNSVQWILHLGLGEDMIVQNEMGKPVRLRFVALLAGSVLQSEVLMSESQFIKHFPSIEGHGFFAMETQAAQDMFAQSMETHLSRFGMDVMTTRFRMARYRAVENTYMATFQMVGGLGALLGTLGVAVLMMRNAAERRGELASMRAIGFSRRRLSWLLFTETTLLTTVGLGIGTIAGLLAVAPTLLTRFSGVPWQDLVTSIAGVGLAGLFSGLLTSLLALQAPIVETLKAEV